MTAELIEIGSDGGRHEDIRRAAKALADGALVAFPTETVYGLAANAALADAVERLRDVKGRSAEQPFTVHIGRRSDWADFVPDPSPIAQRFIKKAWPGPLTLVFPVQQPEQAKAYDRLSPPGVHAIYAQGSVGIRFPDHPIAEQLLTEAAAPIIASSANPTGESAPVEADTIRRKLGDRIDFIIDGGLTRYQKSSTVVSLNGSGYKLLRAGVWDERTIRNYATVNILFVCTGNTCRSPIAEGVFKQMVAQKLGCDPSDLAARGVFIRSAGTGAFGCGPASSEAVEVCRRRGIDISCHTLQGLSLELINPSDYIYVMSRHHGEVVRSLSPPAAVKVALLDPREDIADPAGGNIEEYERIAAKIIEALHQRINEVPI